MASELLDSVRQFPDRGVFRGDKQTFRFYLKFKDEPNQSRRAREAHQGFVCVFSEMLRKPKYIPAREARRGILGVFYLNYLKYNANPSEFRRARRAG